MRINAHKCAYGAAKLIKADPPQLVCCSAAHTPQLQTTPIPTQLKNVPTYVPTKLECACWLGLVCADY